MNQGNNCPQQVDQTKNSAATLVDDDNDFDLPVCQLHPGQEGFESCESCQ